MNKDQLARARKLKEEISNWYPDRPPGEKSLLSPQYSQWISGLDFKKLEEATVGLRAVPRILTELLYTHNGDFSRLSVMKMASLIRWRGGNISGRVTKDKSESLARQWQEMSVNSDLLRQRASDFHEKEQSGRTSRRARSQGASEADGDCTSEAGGSGDESDMEHVTEKHLTLIGREFRDKEWRDGEPEIYRVLHVGWCLDYEVVVAYYADASKPAPNSMLGVDYSEADELLTADWVIFCDGMTGEPPSEADSSCETLAEFQMDHRHVSLVGQTFTDTEEDEVFQIHEVKIFCYKGKDIVGAFCHKPDDSMPYNDDTWFPAEELVLAPWAQWHGDFSPDCGTGDTNELFSDLELFAWQNPRCTSITGGEGDHHFDLPVVELGREEQCLAVSAHVLRYNERRHMTFHNSVTVTLKGGNGERSHLERERDLSTDIAVVFEGRDGPFRVRFLDIASEDDSVYVIGTKLYTISQLPPNLQLRLNIDFDKSHELVESTNPEVYDLHEAVGFVRVNATSTIKDKAENSICHQEAAFVDDDDVADWKLSEVPKERAELKKATADPNSTATKRRRQ